MLFRELIRDGKPYPQRLAWSLQVEVNMEMDGDLTCLSRGYLMLRANATVIEHSVANVANKDGSYGSSGGDSVRSKITGLTWIVERSFAWLGRNRRLSKDYEYRVQTSETMIDLAAIRLVLNRIAPG